MPHRIFRLAFDIVYLALQGRIEKWLSGVGFAKQSVPLVWRVAFLKFPDEDGVGVGARTGFSERRFIIHPCIYNRFVGAAESEEEPESPQKLGSPPMAMDRPKRVAKLEFGRVRIAWNFDQNQV